jgi:hypothetical protein
MTKRIVRIAAALFASLATAVAGDALAITISIPVACAGMQVGTITMRDNFGGVSGEFTANAPMFPTLADAAAKCGEHHFNWYQVVIGDNKPPLDAGGNPVRPPYVDPPPGGYLDGDTSRPGNDTLWADNLPWYWNEGADPPAGTPGFANQNKLANQTTADTLSFEDLPGGLSTNVLFKTWLVSLNADSSFHSFHEGFIWNTVTDTEGRRTLLVLNALGTTTPTRAEYQDVIGRFAERVPEPSSLAALGFGLVCVGAHARQRCKRSAGHAACPAPSR